MATKITKLGLERYFQSDAQLPPICVEMLVSAFDTRICSAGTILARQGEEFHAECLLLSGHVACSISNPHGQEVFIGFYEGTAVLPPHISRTCANLSLTNMEVTSSASIAEIDVNKLMALMVASEPIRNWGNGIMRDELQRRSEHQWALAALNNNQKLVWFRKNYVAFEEKFEHWRIASFLGMTPVSFSRARRQLTRKI